MPELNDGPVGDIMDRHAAVMGPVIDFDTDIEIVGSEGSWVTASDGRRLLDFSTGISVSNLGHQPPAVKQAIIDQLDRVWHSGMVFRYDSLVSAGERLGKITPEGIDKFVFINSGAEAVEASVKLARKVSGRQGVIVFRGGFHGRTMGSVTYTTSKAKYRQGYHPLVGSVFVTPYPWPFKWQMTPEEATSRAVDELHALLTHEISPGEVAAFLVEPVQGEGGYYPAGTGFFAELRRLADEHGILLIADEVQTGFGRTGEWFAVDHYGVTPDIMAMGKAIANGLPLSAVGARADLADAWSPGSHGTTFGGNPVCCAAAVATMDTLADGAAGGVGSLDALLREVRHHAERPRRGGRRARPGADDRHRPGGRGRAQPRSGCLRAPQVALSRRRDAAAQLRPGRQRDPVHPSPQRVHGGPRPGARHHRGRSAQLRGVIRVQGNERPASPGAVRSARRPPGRTTAMAAAATTRITNQSPKRA